MPLGKSGGLFDEGPGAAHGADGKTMIAHIDGGSRGNPGPAGYGAYISDPEGRKLAELSDYLGVQTNNFAEYSGLVAALEYAVEHGYRTVKVVSDSELLVKQMKGQYKVRSEALIEIYNEARAPGAQAGPLRNSPRAAPSEQRRRPAGQSGHGPRDIARRGAEQLRQQSRGYFIPAGQPRSQIAGSASRDQRAARICARRRGGVYRGEISRRGVCDGAAGAVVRLANRPKGVRRQLRLCCA